MINTFDVILTCTVQVYTVLATKAFCTCKEKEQVLRYSVIHVMVDSFDACGPLHMFTQG